jgi:hypothetical protein
VLTCIANLSNDEVFTPPEFANRMRDTVAVSDKNLLSARPPVLSAARVKAKATSPPVRAWIVSSTKARN